MRGTCITFLVWHMWCYMKSVNEERTLKVKTCFFSGIDLRACTNNDATVIDKCCSICRVYSQTKLSSLFSLSLVWQCEGIAGLLWCNLLRSKTFDDLWRSLPVSDINHCWIIGGLESRTGLCLSQYVIHFHVCLEYVFFGMSCLMFCVKWESLRTKKLKPKMCGNDFLCDINKNYVLNQR